VPPSGIGQAVTFFEKTLKKVAISPNPLWQALNVLGKLCILRRYLRKAKGRESQVVGLF